MRVKNTGQQSIRVRLFLFPTEDIRRVSLIQLFEETFSELFIHSSCGNQTDIYPDFFAVKMEDAGYKVFTRVGNCPVYRSGDCRVLFKDGNNWKIGKLGLCLQEEKRKEGDVPAGGE